MKYESGYPRPDENSEAITIDGTEYAPGDQFRYPNGSDPISGEDTYGLCYVLRTDDEDTKKVRFFNVTEEAEIVHDEQELAGAELHKLDEKWDEGHD
jgi:hypothetical protein